MSNEREVSDLVSVEVVDGDVESDQRLCQGYGDVGVQVVILPLELVVFQGVEANYEVSLVPVYVGLPLRHKLVLLAVPHARLYLHLQNSLFTH